MSGHRRQPSVLLKLQEWFQAECNGDWEHSFGFKLETLDNPGWAFEADFEETRWAGTEIPRCRLVRSEADWVQYEVVDNKYMAAGGVANLEEMLETFFRVIADLDSTSR